MQYLKNHIHQKNRGHLAKKTNVLNSKPTRKRSLILLVVSFLAFSCGEKSKDPVAKFNYKSEDLDAPSLVSFNAEGSYAKEGKIKEYIWNFGDNSEKLVTTEAKVEHTFENPGLYKVKLTVKDTEGRIGQSSQNVPISLAGTEKDPLKLAIVKGNCVDRSELFSDRTVSILPYELKAGTNLFPHVPESKRCTILVPVIVPAGQLQAQFDISVRGEYYIDYGEKIDEDEILPEKPEASIKVTASIGDNKKVIYDEEFDYLTDFKAEDFEGTDFLSHRFSGKCGKVVNLVLDIELETDRNNGIFGDYGYYDAMADILVENITVKAKKFAHAVTDECPNEDEKGLEELEGQEQAEEDQAEEDQAEDQEEKNSEEEAAEEQE